MRRRARWQSDLCLEKASLLRLAFIAHASSIHSYRWISYFAHAGFDVTWISPVAPAFPPIEGVRFREVPCDRNPLRLIATAAKLRRLLGAAPPDVLHAHYLGVNGLLGALTGIHPFVATAWGSDVLKAGTRLATSQVLRIVLRTADLVTCDAQHMIEALVKLGTRSHKIQRINFGINTTQFAPSNDRRATRRALGLGEGPVVISLRNLDPLYDVGTLVRAVPRVLERHPDATFIIAGCGTEQEALQSLAQALGVRAAIRFTGRIQNDHLPQYLAAADVYVSTALSDGGIAASTAEAMACALPVVITDFGENADWVGHGKGGFVIPLKAPEALADHLSTLIGNPQLRSAAGAANRRLIQERNDYQTEMAKMAALYAQVGAGSAPCHAVRAVP